MATQISIDVRPLPPRDRHPTLFAAWNELPQGGTLLLTNDHDPLPLYYQFAAEWAGCFRWKYLERGPETWRVSLEKGNFADPLFKPDSLSKGTCRPQVFEAQLIEPLVVDVRPILAAGGSPCGALEQAIGQLIPGQSLVVLAPFEPIPLYTKLGHCGFSHQSNRLADGTWRVEFEQEADSHPDDFTGCGCHNG